MDGVISDRSYEAIQNVVAPSQYRAYTGTYTALNGVYWIRLLSKELYGLIVENLSNIGKTKVKTKKEVVEEDLVYPLVRGRDLKKWFSSMENKQYIILPHDSQTGRPIKEDLFKADFPKTYNFFNSFKSLLERRAIHNLWGKSNPYYSIYDIGDYTYKPYKVMWKEIAGKISGKGDFSVCVVEPVDDPNLGIKCIIPDHKIFFTPTDNKDEAHYITGILNSSIANLVVSGYTVETSISAHVLQNVYIQNFNSNNRLHLEISELSKKAHDLAKQYHEQNNLIAQENLKKVEDQIDRTVATLYQISDEELKEIKKTLYVLKGINSDS